MKILDNPRSGSYAGVTSSRNRNGQYVRNRSIPVNPSSTFQQTVRARLSTNAQDWRSLTSSQRTGWNDLGNQIVRNDTLGQSYPLTGFQAFVMLNNNRLAAGDAKLTDAPLYLPPDPMVSVTPTLTSGSFSIAYTTTPLPAGARIFVSCSPQRSAGRTFEGDYRLITVSAAAAASPLNILAAYTARFGAPLTGARVFISVQQYLNGFLSQPLNVSQVVS
jgi:hypothetical protein